MLALITKIQSLLNATIPLLLSLGMVYFIWGIVMYVIADGEEAKKQGRDRIIYGIIGLAVIVSLWGLVNILKNTFFSAQNLSAPSTANLVPTCSAGGASQTFQSVLCSVTNILSSSVIPLIFSLALVLFVWGVIKFFIIDADEEAKRSQGKQFMIWGIVAFAVIFSVWGIVKILGGNFANTSVLPGVGEPPPLYTPPPGGGGIGGNNRCVPACTSPSVCTNGVCLTPPPPHGNQCTQNSDCNQDNNEYCAGGYCVSPI